MISDDQWLATLARGSRAPSPHNAQPARWQLRGDQLQLFGDGRGWLMAGDPTGRDDLVALGMAWEAMHIALSETGVEPSRPNLERSGGERSPAGIRLVAHSALIRTGTVDPLAGWQERRRSFRGIFAQASREQLADLERCLGEFADTACPLGEAAKQRVAAWYDAAAAAGLRNGAVARELYDFMRFSPDHPRWTRDGLAADCMMLGGLEAWGASWLMRPAVLSALGKLGLVGLLVSERSKVLSATRVVLIHGADGESPFDIGRRWYRFWLAMTATGFSAVPMSALVDSPRHCAELLSSYPLPRGRRLINVIRLGPSPATPAPRSARLPPAELMFTAASETR